MNPHKFIYNLESMKRLKLLKSLIALLLATSCIYANSYPLEFPLTPLQYTDDINGNGYPDFFAFGGEDIYSFVHLYDITEKEIQSIWEFSLSEKSAFIIDAAIIDIDGDGNNEIVAAIEFEKKNGVFYIFNSTENSFSNSPISINYPKSERSHQISDFIAIDWDNDGDDEIAIATASPDRVIYICDYEHNKFEILETVAEDFVQQAFGSLMLNRGDGDNDGVDDLFIISNGIEPQIHQVLSSSDSKTSTLTEFGPIQHFTQITDVNYNNNNEMIAYSIMGHLYNSSTASTIAMDSDNYQHIHLETNDAVRVSHIYGLTPEGNINKFKLTNAETLIPVDIYYASFFADEIINPQVLYAHNSRHAIIFHDGDNPELSHIELEPTIDYSKQRQSDGREANIILGAEQMYRHPIDKMDNFGFSKFHSDSLSSGMSFNLDEFALDWTPSLNQLGFHEMVYDVHYNAMGDLTLIEDDGTTVTHASTDSVVAHNYLLYVNEAPYFKEDVVDFLVMNLDTLNATFSIKDRNVDAILHVGVNGGNDASHVYTNPPLSQIITTSEIELDQDAPADTTSTIENSEEEDTTTEPIEEEKVVEEDTSDDTATETEESNENDTEESGEEAEEIATDTEIDSQPEENKIPDSSDGETDYSLIKKRESHFQWVPNVEPDVYPFTLWVNDLHKSDSLRINVRVHPRIYLDDNDDNFVLTVGKPFQYKVNVTQKSVENGEYNFSILNPPENMRIDSLGVIHWVPIITQVDYHYITVEVDDGIASNSTTFTMYVNAPPVVSKRPAQHLIVEKTDIWTYTMGSFDANATSELTWSLLDAPHTMTMDSLGNLRWMVNEVDYWNYSVQISDGIDSTIFTNSMYSNYPPRITSKPITDVIWINEYTYQVVVLDENKFSSEGDTIPNKLLYSFESAPENMTISADGLIHWQPSEMDEGQHHIVIMVSDGIKIIPQKYTLNVFGPPKITFTDSTSIALGESLNATISHENFRHHSPLSFGLNHIPKNASFNDSTGNLQWQPSEKQVGVHRINSSVKNESESAEKELTFFVYEYPKVNMDAPTEGYVGLTYIYDIQAFDMFGEYIETNGGEVRISSNTMTDIRFDNDTHTIMWSPTESHLGEHEFKVDVVDQFGLTTSVSHFVSVFMSPCELCKSAKREPTQVNKILPPVFKKDTPDKVVGSALSTDTTTVDNKIEPIEIESNVQDSLIAPTDTIDVNVDSLTIPADTLELPTENIEIQNTDTTITMPDSVNISVDTTTVEGDSISVPINIEDSDTLESPVLPDTTKIDTSIN